MMVCLDSDIAINFLRGDKETARLINELRKGGKTISITSINEFELWKGALRSNKKDSVRILEMFLGEVDILLFDSRSSKKSAEIFETLKTKGEMVDVLDVMIASIAMTNNELILTNNKKHFSRINGLNLL